MKQNTPSNHKEMTQLIKRISGQANFIGTPRVYMDLFDGDIVCAVWFNQVVYWDGKNKEPIGFYKTFAEWEAELGLSPAQVRRVADKCEKMGIVNIAFRKVYGTPKNHYLVVWDELLRLINLTFKKVEVQESASSEVQESASSIEGKESACSLSIEEITTKNNLLDVIRNYALSVFGNNYKNWDKLKRKLEADAVRIFGTPEAITISGLSEREGQFTIAEVFQERYGKLFENVGLQITFKE